MQKRTQVHKLHTDPGSAPTSSMNTLPKSSKERRQRPSSMSWEMTIPMKLHCGLREVKEVEKAINQFPKFRFLVNSSTFLCLLIFCYLSEGAFPRVHSPDVYTRHSPDVYTRHTIKASSVFNISLTSSPQSQISTSRTFIRFSDA